MPVSEESNLGSEVFSHAGLLNERSPSLLQTSGVVREQPGRFDLRCHVGYLVLHSLRFIKWPLHWTHCAEPESQARCHREIKSISKRYLEVKDAFSKLAPLSGVRDRVVKAALRKAKHLKIHRGTSHHTWRHCCLEWRTASTNLKEMCRVLPEQRFQSCPRSAFQWHTCTRDRPGPKCSSLVPKDSTNLIVHPRETYV